MELLARNNKFKKSFAFVFLFFCTSLFVIAEPFRVHKTNIVTIDSLFEKKSIEAGVNDAVVIQLPKDKTFIEGIELSIKVPKIIAEWYDSVAWFLYSDIEPEPSENQIDWTGTRVDFGTFGTSLSQNIKVPTRKKHSIQSDAYSYFAKPILANESGFLFLRLQLVMKGASEAVTKSKFTITAYPILSKEGKISLDIVQPEKDSTKELTVFIDGKQSELDKKDILASVGNHTISIVSDFYRNEVRTITVEQAKTTKLVVELRDIKPIIRLVAPENTKIAFDDKKYTAPVEQFFTTPGDHTIRFFVGDYEIVKTVSAINGRSYNISVSIDATITELDE